MNDNEYFISNPLKAVDCCYKSIITLNADFQSESCHIWGFLHKFVYKMTSKGKNREFVTVHNLISAIRVEAANLNIVL